MCDPVSLAASSFAIGAAGAVSKYAAGQQDAAAQLSYQAQERYNAEVARNYEYDQINARQVQEADAAAQSKFDNAIRAQQAVATADASAADNGIEGNSVESVARNFYRQQGRIDASTDKNTQMQIQQLEAEKKGAQARYQQRTNFPEVRQPSMLGLGLEIAGAGVNAYDLFDRKTNPFGKKGGTT